MIRIVFSVAILTVLSSSVVGSDQIPGAPQKKPIALVNAVIHPISGPPIEEGTLVFDQGVIRDFGHRMQPPSDADVIDLKGQHVYPSLIEAHSHIGLQELSSTRATIDRAETGLFNPNVSAHVAVNPDSELIPVTRANGILVAASFPAGGQISGKASVMMLDGWTWEQMTLKPDVAMHINWARSIHGTQEGAEPNDGETREGRGRALRELREFFAQTRAYLKARAVNPQSQRFDLRLQAMESLLNGSMPAVVSANQLDQIQSAVAFAVEQKIRIIIFGGYDAPLCADLLKQYDVPVIVDSIHRDPQREHEDYDAAFTVPERLRRAGVRFCISGSSRAETWNTRNLPYHAATAVAYGLPYDEAMRSVTQYPAEILGISDRVGTLDKGKDATLFVCTGDPLETETSVTHAWIQGRRVDLSSRHTQLHEKYSEKFRQLKAAGQAPPR